MLLSSNTRRQHEQKATRRQGASNYAAERRANYAPSPSLSLYKMVVLPAASRPTIKMRISFLPNCNKKKEGDQQQGEQGTIAKSDGFSAAE